MKAIFDFRCNSRGTRTRSEARTFPSRPTEPSAEQAPERRYASDGKAYTKREFRTFYGDLKEWTKAKTAKPSEVPETYF